MSHRFLLNSKLVPRLCADKFDDLFKQIQMPILIDSSLNINSLQNLIISRKTMTYLCSERWTLSNYRQSKDARAVFLEVAAKRKA